MFKRALILAMSLAFLMTTQAQAAKYELKIQTAVPGSSMYF